MAEFVKVAKTGDLSENSGKLVEVGDKKIALFCTEDGYCAIDDECPHKGGPLSEGEVEVPVCPTPALEWVLPTSITMALRIFW